MIQSGDRDATTIVIQNDDVSFMKPSRISPSRINYKSLAYLIIGSLFVSISVVACAETWLK